MIDFISICRMYCNEIKPPQYRHYVTYTLVHITPCTPLLAADISRNHQVLRQLHTYIHAPYICTISAGTHMKISPEKIA